MPTIRRTVAIFAFAALVAGAFSISCYTVTSSSPNVSGNTVTFPQSTASGTTTSASCLSYSLSGSSTYNGVTLSTSGKAGSGSTCTCAQWASATGCDGVTQAQATAAIQSVWTAEVKTAFNNGAVTVSNPACCDTNNCNSGLGIKISSAALPVVNMLTLLATALVGYVFTSKLV